MADTMSVELVGGQWDGHAQRVPLVDGFLPETIDMANRQAGVTSVVRYIPATREPLKSADGDRRLYVLKGGA
jgi:hypothetical protein